MYEDIVTDKARVVYPFDESSVDSDGKHMDVLFNHHMTPGGEMVEPGIVADREFSLRLSGDDSVSSDAGDLGQGEFALDVWVDGSSDTFSVLGSSSYRLQVNTDGVGFESSAGSMFVPGPLSPGAHHIGVVYNPGMTSYMVIDGVEHEFNVTLNGSSDGELVVGGRGEFKISYLCLYDHLELQDVIDHYNIGTGGALTYRTDSSDSIEMHDISVDSFKPDGTIVSVTILS